MKYLLQQIFKSLLYTDIVVSTKNEGKIKVLGNNRQAYKTKRKRHFKLLSYLLCAPQHTGRVPEDDFQELASPFAMRVSRVKFRL